MKSYLLTIALFLISFLSFGQYSSTDTLSYYSKYFNTKRQLSISLPEGYNGEPNRRYKVIYFFDAQSTALFEFTKATLSYLQSYSSIYCEPVILIGIRSDNRHFDFLPKHENTKPEKNNYPMAGGADTFALSIQNELKPFIDKSFRTNGYNIGIGHSLGGSFVTYSMLKYNKIFNAGIAISPNYLYDNEAIISLLKDNKIAKNLTNSILYISYGNTDEIEEKFKPSTIKLQRGLSSLSTHFFLSKVENLNNDSHSTTPMEGIFKGLIFINNSLTIPRDVEMSSLMDKSKNYIDFIKTYFKRRTEETGIILPTIADINRLAYNCFYYERKKDAIDLIEWAIQLYPDDANLFDSLGEFQQDVGNIEKAKYYYSAGLKIIENQKPLMEKKLYQGKIDWFTKRIKDIQVKNKSQQE